MTEPLPETTAGTLSSAALERIEVLLPKKDVVVLGPGLSRNEETEQLIRTLLPALAETKVVLDADGLNAFAGHADELRSRGLLVLTPHPGELSRLTGVSIDEIEGKRLETAREAARRFGAIVVLKGHRTLTASPSGQVWVNMTGNPGMAKGGSGDVLSGVIAASFHQMQGGFFRRSSPAQGKHLNELMHLRDQGDAAAKQELEKRGRNSVFDLFTLYTASAVCLHGMAGDIARDLQGESSMLATDIMSNIGEALAVCHGALKDKFAYLQR
jgi:NAD(P)H-hydrate epimerase